MFTFLAVSFVVVLVSSLFAGDLADTLGGGMPESIPAYDGPIRTEWAFA